MCGEFWVQNVHHLFSTKCSWFNCKYKCLYKCPPLYLLSSGWEEEAPGDSYLTLSWQKQKFNLLQISLRSTHFVTVVNTANENENLTYCGCGTRSKDALQIECWGLSINEVILVCEADLESLILSVCQLHMLKKIYDRVTKWPEWPKWPKWPKWPGCPKWPEWPKLPK